MEILKILGLNDNTNVQMFQQLEINIYKICI